MDLVQIKDVRIGLAPTHFSIAACSGYWGARIAARKPASLKLSEFVVGCSWCMCARVGRDKDPYFHEFDIAIGRRYFVFSQCLRTTNCYKLSDPVFEEGN
jgi:hypothetical protein